MKSYPLFHCGTLFSTLLLAASLAAGVPSAGAQEKKSTKAKSKPAGKTAAPRTPGATTLLEQHLAANMKLLNVLSRYADTLASATDAATAKLAVSQLETITKDAVAAGEQLVKLGRPAPEIESKLSRDPDIAVTTRRIAEQTRAAIEAIAANAEIKPLITPSIENFQTALNRIQQTASEPVDPANLAAKPAAPKPAAPETAGTRPEPTPAAPDTPPAGLPAKPPGDTPAPAAPATESASVPPPPPSTPE